ncbi:transposable element Tcb2 transposase [Trichonephila clavipes]|nr:transposable element Tcb2 transposase [Trichonephila clavipes]
MSSRHHIDDFMRGRIIGKIEEGRKITDVAREFDIAHSVVSRLWKSLKTTEMCSRRHGGGRVRRKGPISVCSIMVWTSIIINGRTRLHVVANGTLTGHRHIDEVLLPHVRLFRGVVGDTFVFMDDNATCHRTLDVQDCLDSEGMQRLLWPARSPDLNLIERVWDALGRQVAGRNYPPTNRNTLIHVLTEEWDKLPQQLLDNVVQSMVCELHFSDDAIRRYTEAYNEKTGKKICVPLKRYRQQNFAVPTIFTDFPTYLSNSGNPTRECSEKRLQRLENEHLQRSIQSSIISKEEFEKKKSFASFPELVGCLNAEELQDIWTIICKNDLVIIMMLDTIISPVIKASVIISKDLDLTIHIGQTKIVCFQI